MKTLLIVVLTILLTVAGLLFVLPSMIVQIVDHTTCNKDHQLISCHYNEP